MSPIRLASESELKPKNHEGKRKISKAMNSISAVDSLMLETTGELILSPLNFCLDIVSKFKLFCEYATD